MIGMKIGLLLQPIGADSTARNHENSPSPTPSPHFSNGYFHATGGLPVADTAAPPQPAPDRPGRRF